MTKSYLVGQRFGRLTVLEDDGTRTPYKMIKWKCLCDCGKITYVATNNLKNGHTKSCGCYKQEKQKEHHSKDLTGQRFGKLVAKKIIPNIKGNCRYNIWECKCDCGNICQVTSHELLKGHTKSCGCLKSNGEQILIDIFIQNNISFIKEWTGIKKDCINPKTNSLLRFDFYLPDYNCCIEYDGIQHFKNTGWEKFEQVKDRDDIKNDYCKNNNIKLIRIKYTELNLLNIDFIKTKIEGD